MKPETKSAKAQTEKEDAKESDHQTEEEIEEVLLL